MASFKEKIDGVEYSCHVHYICDKKKCSNCSDVCMRTEDIKHAVNYNSQPPLKVLHKKFERNPYILDKPTMFYQEKEN